MIYACLDDRRRLRPHSRCSTVRALPDMLLYTARIRRLDDRGLNVQTTVDRATPGWPGNVGVVTLLVDRLRRCRPATRAVTLRARSDDAVQSRSALERGLRNEQIWVSLERNMQCAVGPVRPLPVGPAFICKEAVFRYDRDRAVLSRGGD